MISFGQNWCYSYVLKKIMQIDIMYIFPRHRILVLPLPNTYQKFHFLGVWEKSFRGFSVCCYHCLSLEWDRPYINHLFSFNKKKITPFPPSTHLLSYCILTARSLPRCQNTLTSVAKLVLHESISRLTCVQPAYTNMDRISAGPCWTGLIFIHVWSDTLRS